MSRCDHPRRHTIMSMGGEPLVDVCASCPVRFFACRTCGEPRPEGVCPGVCRHCGKALDCSSKSRCGVCVDVTCAWAGCGKTFVRERGSRRAYCGLTCRAGARRDREAERRAAG